MKFLRLIATFWVLLNSVSLLNGQMKNKIYVGTYNGVDAVFFFDSLKVKILFPNNEYLVTEGEPFNKYGFCRYSKYSFSNDTIVIESFGTLLFRKSDTILKKIKSKPRSPKDRLEIFDNSNYHHSFLMNLIIKFRLYALCPEIDKK